VCCIITETFLEGTHERITVSAIIGIHPARLN
jgi:hypothetical protein